MLLRHRSTPVISAFTALLLLSATPVYAVEGKALLDKLLSLPGADENGLTWKGLVEHSSDSFTMTEVVLKDKSTDDNATIESLDVRGFKETGDGRIVYESITLAGFKMATKKEGTFTISGMATTDGDVPFEIWKDGLTAEEKKQRIRFGNFSISEFTVDDGSVQVKLDGIAVNDIDIPLDFRFGLEGEAQGEPAKPLKIGLFSIAGGSGSNKADNVTWSMGAVSFNAFKIPTSLEVPITDWMEALSAASVRDVSFSLAGKPMLSISKWDLSSVPPDGSGTMTTTSALEGFNLNLDAVPDPEAKAVFDQLGYSTIAMTMNSGASYNLNSGRASLDSFEMKMKDMFNLDMSYVFTGYTAEVANALMKAQFAAAASNKPEEAFAAIFPQLAKIKLENFRFSITDQSLTGKLLDFQAKQMGTTGDQLAAGAPTMLALGMGQLNMPEFTQMVTEAVGAFLQNKGTISLEAAPSQPVTITKVYEAGLADPTSVPGILGLKVSSQQ